MIRKAKIGDISDIRRIIDPYGSSGKMLPVALSQLYDRLRSFFVYENGDGKIIGTVALHVTWEELAEIRSLVVDKDFQKKGVGKELIETCIDDAKSIGVKRIFVLSFIPEFFENLGFNRVEKSTLPHKVWTDCLNCIYSPDCKETALIIEV